jgi:hypothetical protein
VFVVHHSLRHVNVVLCGDDVGRLPGQGVLTLLLSHWVPGRRAGSWQDLRAVTELKGGLTDLCGVSPVSM